MEAWRGTRSRRRLGTFAALVGVVGVAIGIGVLLWDQLGVMAAPIYAVVAVVLVRLLRLAFFPRLPADAG